MSSDASDLAPRSGPRDAINSGSLADNGKRTDKRAATLGSVRQRDELTGDIILVPRPSRDPNDPLNWSPSQKRYLAFLLCFVMVVCNFGAAAPSIALVSTARDFFPETALTLAISKCAYFLTTTALMQGLGNLLWMPLVNKYGRRSVYLISTAIYLVSVIWAVPTYSYGSFLASRILLGFGSGAAEAMAPLSIADLFFLHERGQIMVLYSAALSCGVSFGIIIAGFIVIHNHWRYIYNVSIAVIGFTLVLAFFTFPETAYIRKIETDSGDESSVIEKPMGASAVEMGLPKGPTRKTYPQRLSIFSGVYTRESFWRLFIRPLAVILLPPVFWCSLVMSATIGFLVAVVSNIPQAFDMAYSFTPFQTGLCYIGAIMGALTAIFFGGSLSDMIVDFFTRRNCGIREPEMRLPAMAICLVTAPLSLILYGVGIENRLHWICPTIGLSLLNFSIVQGTNVALVYTIDAYRPIAGEVTLTTMAFKSCFGFLLSFYTNPWVEKMGYINAFGSMAAISAFVLLFWIPLFIYGKRIRLVTWQWRAMDWVRWHPDREVGE